MRALQKNPKRRSSNEKVSYFNTLISFVFSIQIGYAAPLTSTLKDQQNVSVTIYNSNVGLVKDTRLIDLKPGIHELKFKVKYRIRFKY